MNMRANGWSVFAAVMLMIAGTFTIMQGLVALTIPDYYVIAEADLLGFNFGLWGTLLLIWGVLLWAAAFGSLNEAAWARTAGVALAAISAVIQLAFLPAYPFWSAIMVALSVLAIYGMTTGQSKAEATPSAYRAGRSDAATMPEPRSGTHAAPDTSPNAPGAHERQRP
ncbi:hypothetical protein HDA32_005287 [Spinactinospora alkalitolerans]|uniref:DUF7144 domain-containing protein n=1 Tax=Spinactinospora alkalitolerans TaxID=687207 RepID=A0A852U3K1_9ACTN|nr:hypothetical protein [Spinactinospora alkalitolerans]NYE50167.1 hypothetical protein [Spinactinospora alkalitolerans]